MNGRGQRKGGWTLYYQNVRSLNNKLSYLRSSVNQLRYTPDVLMFTETWLKPTTNDAQIGLKKFCIFRLDRRDSPAFVVVGFFWPLIGNLNQLQKATLWTFFLPLLIVQLT